MDRCALLLWQGGGGEPRREAAIGHRLRKLRGILRPGPARAAGRRGRKLTQDWTAHNSSIGAFERWNVRTAHHAISYADASTAAAAERSNAVLVTGDPELVQLRGRIQVERLHRRQR